MELPIGIRSGSLTEYYEKVEMLTNIAVKMSPNSDKESLYKINSASIGKGPHGRVYIVNKRDTKTPFACKEICCNMYTESHHRQILNCVSIQLQLRHPNINTPIDAIYNQTDLRLYIISPLLRTPNDTGFRTETRPSLRESMGTSGDHELLAESRIWSVVGQITSALKYLHGNPLGTGPIAHASLKPKNIYLDKDGRVKLMDVGMSSEIRITTPHDLNIAVATDLHKAPEQFEVNTEGGSAPDTVNTPLSSDIWALGCYIYELIFKKRPFTTGYEIDLYLSIMRLPRPIELPVKQILSNDNKPGVSYSVQSQFSENLKQVLNGCLSINPNERPSLEEIEKYAKSMV